MGFKMNGEDVMINALISLNADLASSIALRYACRLMDCIDMRLQTMHVEVVDKEDFPPGSGLGPQHLGKGIDRNRAGGNHSTDQHGKIPVSSVGCLHC